MPAVTECWKIGVTRTYSPSIITCARGIDEIVRLPFAWLGFGATAATGSGSGSGAGVGVEVGVIRGDSGSAGAEAVVKRVPETVPEAVAKGAHFKLDQAAPVATVDELPEYDAIVFGGGPEGAERKAARNPLLTKRITSELGNVSPVIVVPGPWSAADMEFHAENLATQIGNNGGFKCKRRREGHVEIGCGVAATGRIFHHNVEVALVQIGNLQHTVWV